MLFTEETALMSEIRGTSNFTQEFPKQGPRDRAWSLPREPIPVCRTAISISVSLRTRIVNR